MANDFCLDPGLDLDLARTGDLLLFLELAVVASWTDCLDAEDEPERPLCVDDAVDKPPCDACDVRDADSARPRGVQTMRDSCVMLRMAVRLVPVLVVVLVAVLWVQSLVFVLMQAH